MYSVNFQQGMKDNPLGETVKAKIQVGKGPGIFGE